MGNTFKLGNYVNGIFQDASNNIGIGGSPSGSYKLEVTGTAKVSSTLLVSGVATFSSSVTAVGATFSSTTALASTGGTSQMRIDRSGSVARIQNYDTGSAANISLAWDGGNVGIGTTGPSAPLEIVAGSATGTTTQILLTRGLGYGSTQFKQYYNSGSDWGLIINQSTDSGGVKLVKDATSWAANTSDARKKKNFEPSQGLEELMKIEPLKYHFEWDDDSIPKRMGFKAQKPITINS